MNNFCMSINTLCTIWVVNGLNCYFIFIAFLSNYLFLLINIFAIWAETFETLIKVQKAQQEKIFNDTKLYNVWRKWTNEKLALMLGLMVTESQGNKNADSNSFHWRVINHLVQNFHFQIKGRKRWKQSIHFNLIKIIT